MSSVSQANVEDRLTKILDSVENESNRSTIRAYIGERRAQGLAPGTVPNEAGPLRDLAAHLEDKRFKDATREDLVAFMNRRKWDRVFRARRKDGGFSVRERKVDLSDRTMECRGVVVKCFYKWLEGDDDEVPKKVRFIKSRGRQNGTLPTDELVTPADLRKLLQAAADTREKAVIAVLYESGLRASELCSLNVGSVTFEDWGAMLTLPKRGRNLKTGARRIMVFRNESEPYLHRWYEDHPHKDDPSAALFFGMSRRAPMARLTPNGLYMLVARTAKKAGVKIYTEKDPKGKPVKDEKGREVVKTRVHPHLFRHTSATLRAKEGWTEGMMRAYFGWTRSSDMPATYVHLADLDYQQMAMEKKGFKAEGNSDVKSGLAPLVCRGCKADNLTTASFCGSCRAPLTPEGISDLARQKDELLAELVQERVREEIKRALADLDS